MLKTAISILLLLININNALAEESLTKEKKDDIIKLMNLTNSVQASQQISQVFISQITNALKSERPDVPTEVYGIVEDVVNATIHDNMVTKGGFMELMLVVYNRHFTHEDIKGMIAFYNTALGKKVIEKMPMLAQESMQVGFAWGKAMAPEIQKRLNEKFKAKGIDLAI